MTPEMLAGPALLSLQGEGIGLNMTTFGIVSAVVLSLVGALTFMWKWATSNQEKYIGRLEREKDDLERKNGELMDALIDVLRTAHRSTDVADEAARELLKRRTKRS